MNNDIELLTQCKTEKMKRKKLFLCCLIGFLVVVSASLAFLFIYNSGRYIPPSFEKSASSGVPTPPNEMGYSVTTINNEYRVGLCGKLTESNSNVNVYFTNVETNSVLLKLVILDESNAILAETGIIKPGQYIEYVHLNNTLEASETPVTLKVMAYESDTYLSAGSIDFISTITHA